MSPAARRKTSRALKRHHAAKRAAAKTAEQRQRPKRSRVHSRIGRPNGTEHEVIPALVRPVLDLDTQVTDALRVLGDKFDEWRTAQTSFENTDPRDPQFLPRASKAHVAFLMYSEAARRAQNVTSPTVRL